MVEKLSEEDKTLFKEAFNSFVQEEGGPIQVEQVGNVLRKMGLTPTLAEIEKYTEVKIRNYRYYYYFEVIREQGDDIFYICCYQQSSEFYWCIVISFATHSRLGNTDTVPE